MREGWRVVRLGDVCEITKGTSPTLKTPPGPFPLIVTGPEPSTSDTFQFDGEAVCVPLVSSTGHGHASLKRVHYASGRFAVANIIAACVPHATSGVNTRYLFHYLQHLKDELIVTRMKGTANVSLSIASLSDVPIALPPVKEQERVVDLIMSIENAIEATSRTAANATRLWHSTCESIKSDSTSTSYSVEELVTVARSGGTPSRKEPSYFRGTIPWLKSGDVRGREISEGSERITSEGLSSSSAWLVPAGSVLVAMYGGGTVGNVGRLAAAMATNQAVLALIPDDTRISAALLYHLLASDSARLATKAIGAAQANISKKIVLGHRLGVPPLDRQAVLSVALDATLDAAVTAHTQADSLRTLRSNLLTVLLSGEHEIPSSYDQLLNLDEEAAA